MSQQGNRASPSWDMHHASGRCDERLHLPRALRRREFVPIQHLALHDGASPPPYTNETMTTARSLPLLPSRRHALAAALLLGAAAWMPTTGRAATPVAADTVVEAVQLPAWVERNGDRRAAEPGQRLRAGDVAVTAAGSRAVLRLSDNSLVKMGEATELALQNLEAGRKDGQAQMAGKFRLVTGVFRYATDYRSKALGVNRDVSLQTATATVGVRGTDFWAMSDAEHDAVCVFEGAVAVMRDGRDTIALNQPGAFWVVFTGQPEKPAGQATPAQLSKFIAQGDLQPGSGVLVQGGSWRTVVATFPRLAEAEALRMRLQKAGYPASVANTVRGHEVRVQQVATRQDAEALLRKLQADPTLGAAQGRVEGA